MKKIIESEKKQLLEIANAIKQFMTLCMMKLQIKNEHKFEPLNVGTEYKFVNADKDFCDLSEFIRKKLRDSQIEAIREVLINERKSLSCDEFKHILKEMGLLD